jgi:hypothetical protein
MLFCLGALSDFSLLIEEILHLCDLRSKRQAALRSLFQRIRSAGIPLTDYRLDVVSTRSFYALACGVPPSTMA